MADQIRTILVTGATGRQGGAVIDALLSTPNIASKFLILALTRDPDSARAQKLLAKAPEIIRLIKGDYTAPTLSEPFTKAKELSPKGKIWGVFSMQDKDAKIYKDWRDAPEFHNGMKVVDQAIKNNVELFIYTSGDTGGEKSWNNPTNVPHFMTKHHLERYLLDQIKEKNSTMKWTILRPTMFFENLEPTNDSKLFMTAYRDILKNKPVQYIATKDIGVFAAKAFLDPDNYQGKAISLAGDEVTWDQLNDAFIKVTGNPIPTGNGLLSWFIFRFVVKQYGMMIDWFKEEGYGANIKELRKIHPELMDAETWLKEKSAFPKKV
ncbi:uncharacterized protein L201_000001 [Kwoniella dendrophila CBS 6074]|uniref:NmrA-like domain-containing protein n=1 Tax=Kwoniella dendrophila CBS 6074 TaxID=1295534 RepID=A0AAX4JJS9_9TREE